MLHDLEAEALRQSHCERKEQPHKCVGVVKICQSGMELDCRICGHTTETLEGVSCIIESARAICRTVGVSYDELCPAKRRGVLLECLALFEKVV